MITCDIKVWLPQCQRSQHATPVRIAGSVALNWAYSTTLLQTTAAVLSCSHIIYGTTCLWRCKLKPLCRCMCTIAKGSQIQLVIWPLTTHLTYHFFRKRTTIGFRVIQGQHMEISQEFLYNRKDNNSSFYLHSMIWKWVAMYTYTTNLPHHNIL